MMRLVAALVLALGASQAAAQAQGPAATPGTYTQDQLWRRSDQRVTFAPAGISFGLRAGPAAFESASEASRPGQGLDNAIQYRSADNEVFATVYVYLPPLAHAGLSAFATDQGLNQISPGTLRTTATRVVDAGGSAGAAIRIDYRGYRGNLASSAAFIKAGRWIVKVRVSGPDRRRAEVESAMAALLDEMRFEGAVRARPAAPLDMRDCPAPPPGQARALPDNEASFADALLASFDAGGEEPGPPRPGGPRLLARFGPSWCRSTLAMIGEARVPILRAVGAAPSGARGESVIEARSVAVAIISDSGTLLEVVQSAEDRFSLLYHRIGTTLVLGAYASTPSDEQIAAVLSGADREAGRARASIAFAAEGGSSITLHELPGLSDKPAPGPTT